MKQGLLYDGLKLALFCAVAAGLLALITFILTPVIEANCRNELCSVLEEMAGLMTLGEKLPVNEAGSGDTGHRRVVYPLIDKTGLTTAYIVELWGEGYGGPIQVLAGVYPDGEIFQVRLLQNSETPALGKSAENREYMTKFRGTGGTKPVPLEKSDLSGTDAMIVTGATVTFQSIALLLKLGSETVRGLSGI